MDLSKIISYAISVVSIIVAVWQAKRNYNLKKYIRAESMETYTSTDILRGSAQACLRALSSENIKIGIQEAGIVEGMAHALFARSIRNIHHLFNYTRNDVDNWITNKRIHAIHKDDFMRYADK